MPQWIEINLGWLIVWKCKKGERLLFTAVAVRMRKFHPLQEPIGSTKFNFFSARERNSANPVIWLVPGAGGIFSYGPPQQAESFLLICFRERQSFTLHFGDDYHRFRWYATLENKTPVETFPKFPSVLLVIDRSNRNLPIAATSVTF